MTPQCVTLAAPRERTEPEPEPPAQFTSRRRFIVWAVLAGLAKPERLTEEIVREIRAEDAN